MTALFTLLACKYETSISEQDSDGDGVLFRDDCDDENPDVKSATNWYRDADGDGYGDLNGVIQACEKPEGYVENSDDCDDSDADINPDTTWYGDSDADGYGGTNASQSCEQPEGFVLEGGDCDDSNADVNPSPENSEIFCDGLDNNCDGHRDIDLEAGKICLSEVGNTDDGAQVSGAKFVGDQTNAEVGFSLAVGDVDQNGIDDVFLGGRFLQDSGNEETGGAYLVKAVESGEIDLSVAAARFFGGRDGNQAGFSLALADVNGDGYKDLLIGAPRVGVDEDGDRQYEYSRIGSVYLYYGDANGEFDLENDADAIFRGDPYHGDRENGDAGRAVARIGNFNGDPYEDFAIGSWHWTCENCNSNGDRGKVTIVYGQAENFSGEIQLDTIGITGPDGVQIDTEDTENLGQALASAGDINGDGLDDLLIGAPVEDDDSNLNAGAVYLVHGESGTNLLGNYSIDEVYHVKVVGERAEHRLGMYVTSGDFDGNGRDIAVGTSYANSSRGGVYVIPGSTLSALGRGTSVNVSAASFVLLGDFEDDQVGPVSAGDQNGDGLDDLLIGAPGRNSDTHNEAGSAVLVYGAPELSGEHSISEYVDGVSAVEYIGESDSAQAGTSVNLEGDVDGDGLADPIIGASYEDIGGAGYCIVE